MQCLFCLFALIEIKLKKLKDVYYYYCFGKKIYVKEMVNNKYPANLVYVFFFLSISELCKNKIDFGY